MDEKSADLAKSYFGLLTTAEVSTLLNICEHLEFPDMQKLQCLLGKHESRLPVCTSETFEERVNKIHEGLTLMQETIQLSLSYEPLSVYRPSIHKKWGGNIHCLDEYRNFADKMDDIKEVSDLKEGLKKYNETIDILIRAIVWSKNNRHPKTDGCNIPGIKL